MTRMLMGMPITIEVVGAGSAAPLESAFEWFAAVDARFSPYRDDSELSRFNRHEIAVEDLSAEMRGIFTLAKITRRQTDGYFDIRRPDGAVDPSGLVKGWAISKAAERIGEAGYADYFVDAGGDVQCSGCNNQGRHWRVGIKNPFDAGQVVKVVSLARGAIATSGNYVRGAHIYNPIAPLQEPADLVSLSVIAADIYDADRFATAAFAMGGDGIGFIERTAGLEGYAIGNDGIATMTSGFKAYLPTC